MRVLNVLLGLFGLLLIVVTLSAALLYWIGAGGPGERWEEGAPFARPLPDAHIAIRDATREATAIDIGATNQRKILFGDLHVHSTFSLDAFAMALPVVGRGRPISDACDFARFCSGLDFWSINDHAIGLMPWKWQQSVEAIRQCDAVAGDGHDVPPYLGWEWTQDRSRPHPSRTSPWQT